MKTFLMGMSIIAVAAFPLAGASMAAAQTLVWAGGLTLAAVSFH